MTLLTIVQGVCGELSLAVPTAVVGSSDRQVLQLLALANQAGRELNSDHTWQAMVGEQTFETVADEVQPDALPADFDRFIANTFFNRSTRREVTGPLTPREYQWIKAQPIFSTVYLAYRERDGIFLIQPPPAAGNTIAYEYMSNAWAKSAAGAPQTSFLADTDTSFLDESLIGLSLKWRFLRAKGLDYSEEMETFERQKEQRIAQDGGNSMLSLSPTSEIDARRVNLPDGNFGVP